MTDEERLDLIRKQTLDSMQGNEWLFKMLLGICGIAELAGLAAVLWLMDWTAPTHRLIFASTMLVWINLALWVYTLAVRNRVGEQRILRSIELLVDTDEK